MWSVSYHITPMGMCMWLPPWVTLTNLDQWVDFSTLIHLLFISLTFTEWLAAFNSYYLDPFFIGDLQNGDFLMISLLRLLAWILSMERNIPSSFGYFEISSAEENRIKILNSSPSIINFQNNKFVPYRRWSVNLVLDFFFSIAMNSRILIYLICFKTWVQTNGMFIIIQRVPS